MVSVSKVPTRSANGSSRRNAVGSSGLTVFVCRLVLGLTVVALGAWYYQVATPDSFVTSGLHSYTMPLVALASSVTDLTIAATSDKNAAQIKAWRKALQDQCTSAQTAEQVQAVGAVNKGYFSGLGSSPPLQPRGDAAIKRCQRVLLDFGANIGDTSGKLMDAGFVGCDRSDDLKTQLVPPAYDMETKTWQEASFGRRKVARNPLTTQFVQLMRSFGSLTGPEDYCYYGVEGNPVFTKQLQAHEDYIMNLNPRPIQHMHFFTESVGAGTDGMTKLYLDTINTEQNFWGSSILQGHQDVRKSADVSKGEKLETVAADVMGYTIGTLLRKTTNAFAPDAQPHEQSGGHFILKVDIEGGEYPLLDEAAREGTLCEYVKMGNQADVYIEYHSQRVTGPNPLVKTKLETKKNLEECGVTFRGLGAWWA
ncbi:predicted protein [Phaeodactylum tricornutum CCAP 1055/1]|jgi:hypothetical protein|uniref:Methyltransferase FkbM domain-containing protein n=1 Tax=Phaeodactylum tricornutum (strain CCAP 1055/1) TaxID=556484 RepID=B7G1G7_PHATC|nr:predicted protein [Phaeodactylum tricornutum CCAP 1055/1]EEC47506.1 predicted protein [Phaeodactylum tricornutum CCAP 1055/1]|eukprot:XP_002180854.1 predicted protein [Phaeodactylum tricornutum CCAP 1055/1]